MSTSMARPVTQEEFDQGHAPCDCGKFTHVFRQCAIERLPKDYSGELCSECGMWMCSIDKLDQR